MSKTGQLDFDVVIAYPSGMFICKDKHKKWLGWIQESSQIWCVAIAQGSTLVWVNQPLSQQEEEWITTHQHSEPPCNQHYNQAAILHQTPSFCLLWPYLKAWQQNRIKMCPRCCHKFPRVLLLSQVYMNDLNTDLSHSNQRLNAFLCVCKQALLSIFPTSWDLLHFHFQTFKWFGKYSI